MTSLKDAKFEETFKEPQYPWRKRNPATTFTNSIIVILPVTIFALGFFLTEIPGALLFILVFIPVQIVVAIFATIWGISMSTKLIIQRTSFFSALNTAEKKRVRDAGCRADWFTKARQFDEFE